MSCSVSMEGAKSFPQNRLIRIGDININPIDRGKLSAIVKLITLFARLLNSVNSPLLIIFEKRGNKTRPKDDIMPNIALVSLVAAV